MNYFQDAYHNVNHRLSMCACFHGLKSRAQGEGMGIVRNGGEMSGNEKQRQMKKRKQETNNVQTGNLASG